jgi:hypothetical protein
MKAFALGGALANRAARVRAAASDPLHQVEGHGLIEPDFSSVVLIGGNWAAVEELVHVRFCRADGPRALSSAELRLNRGRY